MNLLARALLALLLLTGTTAAHPAPRLTEWLAALPDARLARDDASFLAWRRKHPDLVQRLIGHARDDSSVALQAGALRALASLAEDPAIIPNLSGSLAPLVKAARSRAALRQEARRHLAAATASTTEAVAKAVSPACARELLDLALDPLLSPPALRPRALHLLAWREGPEADAALARILSGAQGVDVGPLLSVLRLRQRLVPTARRLFGADGVPSAVKARLARWLGANAVRGAANAVRRLERRAGLSRGDQCDVQVALLLLDPQAAATHTARIVGHALAADDAVADAALRGLAQARPPQLELHLARAFVLRDPGGARRVRAIHLAEVLGVAAFAPRLAQVALDVAQPARVQQAALHALGTLGGGTELRALATTLTGTRTDHAPLRREAADAARRAHARQAVPAYLLLALEEALPRESEPTVRGAILRALAAIGATSSHAALQRLLAKGAQLRGREARTLLATASALGLTSRAAASELLSLHDRDPRSAPLGLAVVRYSARLTPQLAVPALISLLRHRVGEVAQAAQAELLRRWPQARRADDERTPATSALSAKVRSRWSSRWQKEPQSFR